MCTDLIAGMTVFAAAVLLYPLFAVVVDMFRARRRFRAQGGRR